MHSDTASDKRAAVAKITKTSFATLTSKSVHDLTVR